MRKRNTQVVRERAIIPGGIVFLDLSDVDVADRAIRDLLANNLGVVSAGGALGFSRRNHARHGAYRCQLSLRIETFPGRVFLA